MLRYLKESVGARWRIVCVPHAGAGVSVYRHWAQCFVDDFSVLGAQLPGREDRWHEAPYGSISLAAQGLADSLACYKLDSLVLFGHSMGALLAFETCRILEKMLGHSPAHLVVSGRTPPGMPSSLPRIAHLPDAQFLAEVVRLGGVSMEVLESAELMAMIAKVLREDFKLCEAYNYEQGPALSCPIIVMAGKDDALAPPEKMAQWSDQTTAECAQIALAGDHFYLTANPARSTHAISHSLLQSLC